MMNEKWLNDLHDTLEDYETDEPLQLWGRIEKELPPPPHGEVGRMMPARRWKAGIAAAAVAIVAIGLGMAEYARRNADEMDKAAPQAVLQAVQPDEALPAALPLASHSAPPAAMPERPKAAIKKRTASLPTAAAQPTAVAEDVHTATASEEEHSPSAAGERPSTPAAAKEPAATKQTSRQPREQARPTLSTHLPGRTRGTRLAALSMDVFTTGGTGYSALQSFSQHYSAPTTGPNNTQWEDSPMLGILLYNQGKQTATDIHHRLPVKAGLSFEYRLNNRISLASGVTYTNLVSDIREGSESHYRKGTQRLHYVGIPVMVKCSIASWGRLNVYGGAGLMAEQCVQGRTDNDYVLNNTQVEHTRETIRKKPFQLSANVSAGIQYDLTRTVGVYAEPGASYYFDDGSSLNTIYKEKPMNFNLNLGIRLAFGKKNRRAAEEKQW